MSNLGLDKSLAEAGIRLVRTEVGDPAVCREMRANGYNLGGEQSGHVIFMDCSTTGDGLITTLMVLEHMLDSGKPLDELRAMRRFPQVLHNVKVRKRVPFSRNARRCQRTIGAVERAAAGQGTGVRALLRHRNAGPRDDRGRRRDRKSKPARARSAR